MGVLHCPPNSVFKDFIGDLERVIKLLTFLMGDFNINLFKLASDKEVQSFENLFLSEGLHPSISLAKHKRSSQEGTCIDNILCNQIEIIQHSGVISDQGSSHSPILSLSHLDFDIISSNSKVKHTQHYSFSKKNTDRLLEILQITYDSLIGSYNMEQPDLTCSLKPLPKLLTNHVN